MRRVVVVSATLALAVVAAVAFAAWVSSGSGTARVGSDAVPAGATPTASAAGAAVTVSWTQVLFPSTATPVAGYVVRRYASPSGTEAVVGAGCSGTIAALTCT